MNKEQIKKVADEFANWLSKNCCACCNRGVGTPAIFAT